MRTAYASYGGLNSERPGAEFTLELGPEPSVGFIVVRESELSNLEIDPKEGADLTFRDGTGGELTLKHIFVDGIDPEEAGTVRLSLVDSRVKWVDRVYTGVMNWCYDDNQTVNSKTKGTGDHWTIRRCVDAFLIALSTSPAGVFAPSFTVSPKLDQINDSSNPLVRDVNNEFRNAGDCIQGVLNCVGGFVSIDFKANIRVSMPGDDYASSMVPSNIINRDSCPEALASLHKPKQVKYRVKILREKRFTNDYWEPVMRYPARDKNGKLLDATTDGRPGEWGTAKDVLDKWGLKDNLIKRNYYSLKKYLDTVISNKDMLDSIVKAIHDEFYKVFRYKGPLTTSEESREQVLPFHSTTATFSRADEDEKHAAAPAVADKTYGIYTPENNAKKLLDHAYVDPFCVTIEDQNQGIIKFNVEQPVCKVKLRSDAKYNKDQADFELDVADVNVIVSYFKKFISTTMENGSTLAQDYYLAGGDAYSDEWSGLDDNGETANILVDDMYYIEQSIEGGSWTAINQTEIDAEAERRAEDFFVGFKADEPAGYTLAKFNANIDHLDNGLRSITLQQGDQGGLQILQFNGSSTEGLFTQHAIERIDPTGGKGRTVRFSEYRRFTRVSPSTAAGPTEYVPESSKFRGLMAHCRDMGKGGGNVHFERAPRLVNPATTGVIVAEDWAHSGGLSGEDTRAKHGRVWAQAEGRALYKHVHKNDLALNDERAMWESRLVAMEVDAPAEEKKKPEKEPAKTTGGGPTDEPSGRGVVSYQNPDGSYTRSQAPTAPSIPPQFQGPNDKAAGSTYVFTKSQERGGAYKGPLHHVFYVDKHRADGKDSDGNHKCRLALHEKLTYYHQKDDECGPQANIGKHKRPPPEGVEQAAAKIFDEKQQAWDWICFGSGGGIPPCPPTPGPGPGTPTPGPGGGGGGGGGKKPGPVTTPGSGPRPGGSGPSSGTPKPGGSAGTGVVITPTGGGIKIYPPRGIDTPPWPDPLEPIGPQACGWTNEPPEDSQLVKNIIRDGGIVSRYTKEFTGVDPEFQSPELKSFTGGYNWPHITPGNFDPPGDYRAHYPWFRTWKWDDIPWSPGGKWHYGTRHRGSIHNPDLQGPYTRPSPRWRGSAPLSAEDETKYDIADQPTSFQWTPTAFSGERLTDTQWKSKTSITEVLQDLVDKLNAASGRIEQLESTLAVLKGDGQTGGFVSADIPPKVVTVVAGQIIAGL